MLEANAKVNERASPYIFGPMLLAYLWADFVVTLKISIHPKKVKIWSELIPILQYYACMKYQIFVLILSILFFPIATG